MKNLIIVGAGGFGTEIYTLAKECIAGGQVMNIKGFLDSNNNKLDSLENYPNIICDLPEYEIMEEDVFIIAITSPERKRICYEILSSKGAKFISLIHPSANLTQGVTVEEGCIISRDCIISNDCTIRAFTTFNSRAMVGHGTHIGRFTHINAGAFIGGNCKIGNEVTVHTMAIIIQNINIGEKAVIGAGSVIIKDVEAGSTMFGNPSKRIL